MPGLTDGATGPTVGAEDEDCSCWAEVLLASTAGARGILPVSAQQLADPEHQQQRHREDDAAADPVDALGQPTTRMPYGAHARHGSERSPPIGGATPRVPRLTRSCLMGDDMSDLHEPILRWYDEHARDLPWRGPGATPWAVMVSEFMLQQTPVARVLPVFETWMTTWPTPGALADAPSGEAVRAWGRLGLPASRAAAARGRTGDRRAARRRGAGVVRRADRAAGSRRLHRERDRLVRLRWQPRRAGHQRAPGVRPGRRRGGVPRHRGHQGGAGPRRVAGPRRAAGHLGGRGDGARRAGVHGREPVAARPARSRTGASGTPPAARRTTDRRGAARPGPAPTGWSAAG